MKNFNTTGPCVPLENYMVNINDRMKAIKHLVDNGKYFTINRAGQYGKTTTLNQLEEIIRNQYCVLYLDFQDIGKASFETEEKFVQDFSKMILEAMEYEEDFPDDISKALRTISEKAKPVERLIDLFLILNKWCKISERQIVMFIDEIDTASDNQIFLDFLAKLRAAYLKRRRNNKVKTFQSVILTGVTDVKHLKGKIREDACKVNSPWNIAMDFTIDMSLSEEGIKGMLEEYAVDHQIKMDVAAIANQIRDYTNGYPYLVSRICQKLDENMVPEKFRTLTEAWTAQGVDEAVKIILEEKSTLFESLTAKLTNYHGIRDTLYRILMYGESIPFNIDQEEQNQMFMYGFISDKDHNMAVSNRIFETRLYNLFLSDDEMKSKVFFSFM